MPAISEIIFWCACAVCALAFAAAIPYIANKLDALEAERLRRTWYCQENGWRSLRQLLIQTYYV